MKLRTSLEWYNYTTGRIKKLPKRPYEIPKTPKEYYKNKGWIGWKDWLGDTYNYNWANEQKQNSYPSFQKAKKIISKFKLTGINDFKRFKNSKKFPKLLPKNPYYYSNDKDWKGLLDYLGNKF